ncbi:MAG: hypothetical protein F4Y89_13365 [Gammaproteobacteria bacterium]|nr:hypothetical protein [Gammaproteobacteria bacterium]MYG95766.1 hypothetical protein [Gammaproteobacteria bacterium]
MRKFLIRLAIPAMLGFACLPLFAAEDCPENQYRTPIGGCYPVWYGQTENGGYYTIAIPEGWMPDKGLVIWNHGLQTYLGDDMLDLLAAGLLGDETASDVNVADEGEVEPEPEPGLGAVAAIVLSQGYAMAASSYLQTGWAVFDSHLANGELYEKFLEIAADFGPGPPDPLYLLGGSLGGIVSLRDIEEDLIPQPDGALLLCGAVAGSENWRNAYDLRMIAETVCAGDGQTAFPTPWYEIPALGREIDWIRELDSCTALSGRIAADNKHDELQREIDDLRARKEVEDNLLRELDLQQRIGRREAEQRLVIETWKQVSSNRQVDNYERIQRLAPTRSAVMFTVGMFYGTFLMPRLIQEPGKLDGLNPFHNVAVDYGDEQVNQRITRSIGLPAARRALARNYTPSGAVGDTRIVSIHTSKDGIVSVENQSTLQSLVAPGQLSVGVIAESAPSHCDFRESEVIAAWNLLQDWVEGGSRPDVADMQDECRAVVARSEAGDFPNDWDRAPDNELHPGNRCRYAPDFVIGPQVQLYPREEQAGSAGSNIYDAATGVISVGEAEVTLDDGKSILAFELAPSDPANLVFSPRNIEQVGTANEAWQHRALVDRQFRFYLPDLSVRNDPNLTNRLFNVYMRVTDDLRFEFLDFE